MDVFFEVQRGRSFSIEVGFFDTILEIKEKVQKYQSIPVSKQTLIFKGQVLQDDGDVWKCEILHNSRIQLIVTPDSDNKPVNVKSEEFSSSPSKIHDHQSENSENDVSVRPCAATSSETVAKTGCAGGSKKLKVWAKNETKKIPVEVNASDNVGELRKELHKLQQRLQFHLPQEGYFFIYEQNVMNDDRSFRWHNVRQGDTIEIFNGSVTGGT